MTSGSSVSDALRRSCVVLAVWLACCAGSVSSQNPGDDPAARAASRRASLEKDDVVGRLSLAAWCSAQGLGATAAELWREVLALDPKNVSAHRGLGHVFRDGAWDERPEARDAERARLEALLRRAGLVRFGAGWETPDGARRRARGEAFVAGQWRRGDAIKAAKGWVRIGDTWVEPGEALGRTAAERLTALARAEYGHRVGRQVIVVSRLAPADAEALAATLDHAVGDTLVFLGERGGRAIFAPPVRVVVVTDAGHLDALQQWIPYEAPRAPRWGRAAPDGTGIRMTRDRTGRPVLQIVVDGDWARIGAGVRSLAVYACSRLTIARFAGGEDAPFWIAEGIAGAVQGMRSPGAFATVAGGKAAAPTEVPAMRTADALRAAVGRAKPRPFAALMALRATDAALDDVLNATAAVTWMLGAKPGALGRCVAAYADAKSPDLDAIFGTTGDLDAAFAAWLTR